MTKPKVKTAAAKKPAAKAKSKSAPKKAAAPVTKPKASPAKTATKPEAEARHFSQARLQKHLAQTLAGQNGITHIAVPQPG